MSVATLTCLQAALEHSQCYESIDSSQLYCIYQDDNTYT